LVTGDPPDPPNPETTCDPGWLVENKNTGRIGEMFLEIVGNGMTHYDLQQIIWVIWDGVGEGVRFCVQIAVDAARVTDVARLILQVLRELAL